MRCIKPPARFNLRSNNLKCYEIFEKQRLVQKPLTTVKNFHTKPKVHKRAVSKFTKNATRFKNKLLTHVLQFLQRLAFFWRFDRRRRIRIREHLASIAAIFTFVHRFTSVSASINAGIVLRGSARAGRAPQTCLRLPRRFFAHRGRQSQIGLRVISGTPLVIWRLACGVALRGSLRGRSSSIPRRNRGQGEAEAADPGPGFPRRHAARGMTRPLEEGVHASCGCSRQVPLVQGNTGPLAVRAKDLRFGKCPELIARRLETCVNTKYTLRCKKETQQQSKAILLVFNRNNRIFVSGYIRSSVKKKT